MAEDLDRESLIPREQNQEDDTNSLQKPQNTEQHSVYTLIPEKEGYWQFIFGFYCDPKAESKQYDLEEERHQQYLEQQGPTFEQGLRGKSCCEKFWAHIKFNLVI